jgi:hypothetical protein
MFILQRLRRWSFTKLVLVCVGWLGLCVLTPIAYVAAMVYLSTLNETGSGGIGAVSAGISAPLLVAFGPIVVLVVLWIFAKRSAGITPRSTRSGPSEPTGGGSR